LQHCSTGSLPRFLPKVDIAIHQIGLPDHDQPHYRMKVTLAPDALEIHM
jgi:hypothetical protein